MAESQSAAADTEQFFSLARSAATSASGAAPLQLAPPPVAASMASAASVKFELAFSFFLSMTFFQLAILLAILRWLPAFLYTLILATTSVRQSAQGGR